MYELFYYTYYTFISWFGYKKKKGNVKVHSIEFTIML